MVVLNKSAEHPDYPITKKAIRCDSYSASHMYDDGPDLRFVEFAYFDLKGWFPTRLLNMFIGAMATA